MPAFTFYFLEQDGEARAFDVRVCSSEHEARKLLSGMFEEHGACAAIEIWCEEEKRCTARRGTETPMRRTTADTAARGPQRAQS